VDLYMYVGANGISASDERVRAWLVRTEEEFRVIWPQVVQAVRGERQDRGGGEDVLVVVGGDAGVRAVLEANVARAEAPAPGWKVATGGLAGELEAASRQGGKGAYEAVQAMADALDAAGGGLASAKEDLDVESLAHEFSLKATLDAAERRRASGCEREWEGAFVAAALTEHADRWGDGRLEDEPLGPPATESDCRAAGDVSDGAGGALAAPGDAPRGTPCPPAVQLPPVSPRTRTAPTAHCGAARLAARSAADSSSPVTPAGGRDPAEGAADSLPGVARQIYFGTETARGCHVTPDCYWLNRTRRRPIVEVDPTGRNPCLSCCGGVLVGAAP
jgi:hypothetical protein